MSQFLFWWPQDFDSDKMLQMIVIFLVSCLIIQKWKKRHVDKLFRQLKSSFAALPFVGHIYLLLGNEEDRMKRIQQLGIEAIASGGTTAVWHCYKLYIMIADSDVADIVMKTCLEKDDLYKCCHLLTGDGSIFAPVSKWRPRRRFLSPTFNTRNLNKFVDVFSAQSCILADKLKDIVGKGPTSMEKVLSSLTMDSICETTLGFKSNAQKNTNHFVPDAVEKVLLIIAARICQPWLHTDFMFKQTCQYQTLMKYKTLIVEFIDKIIEQTRRANRGQPLSNTGVIKSFIELMVESEMNESDAVIHEESFVILAAATDTSAVGLGYTLLMLASHPEVQEKVYQELNYVFGDSDIPISADDLHHCKYLEAVIKETLRLYPPVPVIARKIDKHITLPSGIILLPGCGALINIWAINRNPHYWGEDADQFRPERFLDSVPTHPAAFMTFSYGPRNCLGLQYASLLSKTVIATLLKKYRILPASSDFKKPLRVKFGLMMRHVDNYSVEIEARN